MSNAPIIIGYAKRDIKKGTTVAIRFDEGKMYSDQLDFVKPAAEPPRIKVKVRIDFNGDFEGHASILSGREFGAEIAPGSYKPLIEAISEALQAVDVDSNKVRTYGYLTGHKPADG